MKVLDEIRERRIRILNARMCAQFRWGQKADARRTAAWMAAEIRCRSADQVARMERERGLAG